MADGKDIEIKLKATGGDAAAREVEAVGDALSATAQAAEMFAGVDTSDVAGAQAAAFADEAKQLADLEQAYNDAAVAEAELTVKKQERAAKDEAFYAARAKETEAARAAYVASEKAAEVMRAEANAARELAKAQEELAKAQAKPPVEVTPLFEWGPEVGSTAAAKQHAAAVEAMGKAYEKAATEAAELAQAQEDAAKEEAAEAAERQEDALNKLGSSVANLIPGYGAMKEKVTKVREAWALASAGGATFGQRLLALAGGPVGIATAAVAVLAVGIKRYFDEVKRVAEQNRATNEALREYAGMMADYAEANDTAATSARDYATALDQIETSADSADRASSRRLDKLQELIKAEGDYARQLIALDLAQGKISESEAAKRTGQTRVTELDRANHAEIAAADEQVESVAKAIASLTGELLLAKQSLGESERGGTAAYMQSENERQRVRATEARRQADFVASVGGVNGPDIPSIEKALGGPDAIRDLLSRFLGIENGSAVDVAFFQHQLSTALSDRAAAEAKELDRIGKAANEEGESQKAIVDAKRAEVSEIEAAIASKQRDRTAAAERAQDARAAAQLDQQLRIPGIQAGVDTQLATIAAQKKKEADAAAKEAKEKQDREAEKDSKEAERQKFDAERAEIQNSIKAESPGLARRGDRVENAGPGLKDAAAAIDGAAKAFADGSTVSELEGVLFTVEQVMREAPDHMRAAITAAVSPLQASALEFKRRLAGLEEREKNNPSR